jgi:hypothetical protein
MADLGLTQQLILLAATAAVSGLGVPIVLKRIDESRTQELKNREAAISRQAKIIDAQASFLDELSQVLWEWRYAAMKITYYGSSGKQELYEQSCEEYQSEIWLHLNKIRCITSKSRRLASENCYQELLKFYFRIVDLDKRIFKAINIVEPKWERELELSDLNVEIFELVSPEIDELLFLISHRLGLQSEFRRSL